MPAAERGFAAGDAYVIGVLFCGIAVIAAIGALSHERERAFSASLVYLALGAGAALVIDAADIAWVDPLENAELVERIAELAVIIALFGTGLKLDRQLTWSAWSGVIRLLASRARNSRYSLIRPSRKRNTLKISYCMGMPLAVASPRTSMAAIVASDVWTNSVMSTWKWPRGSVHSLNRFV